MSESRSLFATVIEEHLALKRRNARLNGEQPLDTYQVADPFENHGLFKTEADARREEEETGEHPAIVLDWPTNGADHADEAWLDQTQCHDFDWGD
jgi:hypothetical protein